jgi:hypothetical protein
MGEGEVQIQLIQPIQPRRGHFLELVSQNRVPLNEGEWPILSSFPRSVDRNDPVGKEAYALFLSLSDGLEQQTGVGPQAMLFAALFQPRDASGFRIA